MKKIHIIGLCGALCAPAIGFGQSYYWNQLDSRLQSYMAAFVNPRGYTFRLFTAAAELHSSAYGKDSRGANETLNPDTQEIIASATKMPSSLAILKLTELTDPNNPSQKLLDLDTPVDQYFPTTTAGIQIKSDWDNNGKSAITMRMLLNHTSGLPGLASTQPDCMSDSGSSDSYTSYTLEQCVAQIAPGPMDFKSTNLLCTAPGMCFDYGALSYQVAGYVAISLYQKKYGTAVNWQQYFNWAIGSPLGISSEYSFNYDSHVDPRIKQSSDLSNPRIAGGAGSSTFAYEKILQMLMNGGLSGGTQVLNSSTVNLLFTNQLPWAFTSSRVYFAPIAASNVTGYTFGFWIPTASFYSGEGTTPSDPTKIFADVGKLGTIGWIDNGSAGPSATKFGAINIIYHPALFISSIGLSMHKDAESQVLCQLASPGSTSCPTP